MPASRFASHLRRLWVLPAFTVMTLAVLAALLGNAPPLEAQTLRPNLTLLKTGPLVAQVGSQVAFTLTLANTGFAAASNVTVTDQTPAGLVFEGFGGACSGTTCTFPTLGIGAVRTIRVTFTIPSDYNLIANPIITNTASVTSTSREVTLVDNTGIWATVPFARADLELTKQASTDVVARGENVTYTLALTNNGPNTAFAVSVLDILTPTLPFVTGTAGICNFVPVLTGTIILCDNLPVGSSHIITAVHAVPLDWVTPTVSNTGLAGSISIDPNYFNNVATSTITITSRADMSITKEGPAMVVPGTDAVFTLTVKNLGPSKALTVTVDDPGFNGLTPTNAGACEAGFPCDLGTMFPNSETQVVMSFTVPSSFTETEVVNMATVTSMITDLVEVNNTSTVTVPVVRISDLDIVKEGPATAVPGAPITYTIVVTNNGPSDAAEVTLTDTEPISLTDAGNPCVAGVCSLPDLPVGMSATLTLSFNIDPFARGTVTNTASVTSTGTQTPVVASAATELAPEADVVIYKTDGQASAAFGTPLTYTIVVSNNGPSGVAGAYITDPMPDQLKVLAWNCEAVLPNSCVQTYTNSTTNVLDVDATLAPNSAVTITVSGLLTTTFADQKLSNTVTVTLPAGVTETNPTDNVSTDETSLIYIADVFVTKTVTPADSVAPGELLTYVVAIGNAGPSKAIDATVYDYLPWRMQDAQWICEATDGATCDSPSGLNGPEDENIALEPGSFVTYTITGTLSLEARGTLYNEVCANVGEGISDPDWDNNCADVSVPIQSEAYVSIGKTDGLTIAVPGTTITYVITLANDGPSNANGLVYDIFPPELTNAQWLSDSLNGAQVISDLNGITTSPGVQIDLPAGSLLTITVSGNLNLTATGWLTNIVEFAIGNETPVEDECEGECECRQNGPFRWRMMAMDAATASTRSPSSTPTRSRRQWMWMRSCRRSCLA